MAMAFATPTSAQRLQKMLSLVKLCFFSVPFIFFTVMILFSTPTPSPNSPNGGRFHHGLNNLSHLQIGVPSLAAEAAADYNYLSSTDSSPGQKINTVMEEIIPEDRKGSLIREDPGNNQPLRLLSSDHDGAEILQPYQNQFDQTGIRTSQASHITTDFHVKDPTGGSEETEIHKEAIPVNSFASVERAVLDQKSNCDGWRVFMYDLPPKFNTGILEKCNNRMVRWLNFCPHLQNHGYGRQLKPRDWYATDAYMLEVIFHARMKVYSCLTLNSSLADAFFIPYYVGLDALRYLYGADQPRKYDQGLELLRWLEEHAQESWSGWGGRDHFIVAGRTAWDFGNPPENKVAAWGTSFLELPAMAGLTSLVLEKRPWRENEQAIPYPTSFHPSSSLHLHGWISKVASSQRKFLFAFVGAARPQMRNSIRDSLFRECHASSSCAIVNCSRIKCAHSPQPIVQTLLQARFCLQPAGDTSTRRSTFDSIVAGCIPVFFYNDSAYTQYTWHFPADPDSYSVFIPASAIRNGALVENILRDYSDERVKMLQVNVRRLIQRILYVSRSEVSGRDDNEIEDAFEVSVKSMLKKAAKLKAAAAIA